MADESTVAPKTIRSMMDWNDGDTTYIAFGACSELWVAISGSDRSDLDKYTFRNITPTTEIGLAVDDPTPRVGYGSGAYSGDDRLYGRERPDTTSDVQPTTIWGMDLWGRNAVFHAGTISGNRYGELYQWDGGAGPAVYVEGSPTGCRTMAVQTERYCMLFGTAHDPTLVSWCDRENINDWTARPENEAGDYNLRSEGTPMSAVSIKGKILILTTKDAHYAQSLGPPFIQGFRTLHGNCGAISPQAHASTGDGVYWMGLARIYHFDGVNVTEVNCDLEEVLEHGINVDFAGKIHAVNDARNSSIIWFYPSSGSTEIDSYLTYNYSQNTWSYGRSNRTAFISSRIFENSIGVDKDSNLFLHDKLLAYTDADGKVDEDKLPFAETTPVSFDKDNRVVEINEIIPDLKGEDLDGVKFRLKSAMSLHGKEKVTPSEDKEGLSVPAGKEGIQLRVSGKQFKLRIEGQSGKDWSLGNVRFNYGVRGRR